MAKKDKYPQVGPADWMNQHGWYAQNGGGVLPAIMPGTYPGNMPVLMNQQATIPMHMDIPEYEHGGYHPRPGYFYNGHGMVKAIGSGTYDTGTGAYFAAGGPVYSYEHVDKHGQSFNIGRTQTPLTQQQLDYNVDMSRATPYTPGSTGSMVAMNSPYSGGYYKKGGIHINPANKGKFNALKKRTGKTTEELTHSKNPLTRKRAIFAQNARKWHHEQGGPVNPFHPMYQYMATGGYYTDGGDTDPLNNLGNSNPWASTAPMQPAPAMPQMTNPDPNMAERNQKYTTNTPGVSPMSPTNDQMVDASGFNDPYAQQAPTNTADKQPRQYKGLQVAAGILGAGTGILGAASLYHDRFQGQKTQQQWMRDQNKSDNLPHYQNPMSKGTYDQYGNIPYNNMSQSPNIHTMGQGGYVKGQEVELDEKQINELIRKGYKLQRL